MSDSVRLIGQARKDAAALVKSVISLHYEPSPSFRRMLLEHPSMLLSQKGEIPLSKEEKAQYHRYLDMRLMDLKTRLERILTMDNVDQIYAVIESMDRLASSLKLSPGEFRGKILKLGILRYLRALGMRNNDIKSVYQFKKTYLPQENEITTIGGSERRVILNTEALGEQDIGRVAFKNYLLSVDSFSTEQLLLPVLHIDYRPRQKYYEGTIEKYTPEKFFITSLDVGIRLYGWQTKKDPIVHMQEAFESAGLVYPRFVAIMRRKIAGKSGFSQTEIDKRFANTNAYEFILRSPKKGEEPSKENRFRELVVEACQTFKLPDSTVNVSLLLPDGKLSVFEKQQGRIHQWLIPYEALITQKN